MARIAIDATPVSITGKGLSRFLTSLITALAKHTRQHEFIVFLNAKNMLPDLPTVPHIKYVKVPLTNSLLWDIFQFPLVLRRQTVDLVFSCSDRLPILYNGRLLLYLFELPGFRHQLNWASASRYAKLSMKITDMIFPFSVRRAKRIIASSHATKEAVCSSFGIDAERVDVIYPGRDETFTPEIKPERRVQIERQLNAPSGYILHFSSVSDPRDNTEVALRAFHASHALLPNKIRLVIAGKANPDAQGLTPVIRELGLETDIAWAGFVPEGDLADTYRSALVYLDTSLYEGFGYQVLEAMSCGTPVICSNVTSLPEIVGDAGVTIAPQDINAFSNAIVDVLKSAEQQKKMRTKGLEQVQKFSWSQAAVQLVEVIESTLCE